MVFSLPPPQSFHPGDDFDKWLESVKIYMRALDIVGEEQRVNISSYTFWGQMF